MAYTIRIHSNAEKHFRKLSPQAQKQIAPVIDSLADNPRPQNVEKLAALKDCYRVRSGDFRIVYTIRDNVLIVLVLAINDRKEAYTKKSIESLKKTITRIE